MARRKRGDGGSSWSYFGKLFEEHPEWLDERSNDLILARYREDHGLAPDAPIDKTVKNNLANIKSVRRKMRRDKAKAAGKSAAAAAPATTTAAAATPRRSGGKLEELELLIDDCLTMARNLGREGMEEIITQLRRARREVVWKMGE